MKNVLLSLIVGGFVFWMAFVFIDTMLGAGTLSGIGWSTCKVLLSMICGAGIGGLIFQSLDRSTR
jgi:energy-converting hydrogenase Eha subunit B